MTKVKAIIRDTTLFNDEASDLTLWFYDKLLITEPFYIDETMEIDEVLESVDRKFDYFTCNMKRGSIELVSA